jgi:hypothetical protein
MLAIHLIVWELGCKPLITAVMEPSNGLREVCIRTKVHVREGMLLRHRLHGERFLALFHRLAISICYWLDGTKEGEMRFAASRAQAARAFDFSRKAE